jgi:hypothetical protein
MSVLASLSIDYRPTTVSARPVPTSDRCVMANIDSDAAQLHIAIIGDSAAVVALLDDLRAKVLDAVLEQEAVA